MLNTTGEVPVLKSRPT